MEKTSERVGYASVVADRDADEKRKEHAANITRANPAAARFWLRMLEGGVAKLPQVTLRGYGDARALADEATIDASERGCFRGDVAKAGT